MKSKKIYLYIINLIILLISLIIILSEGYYRIESLRKLLVISVIIQLINIFINRKNNIVVIFGIFLLSYYIPIFQKYYMGYEISPYGYTVDGIIGIKTMVIYCIFVISYSALLIVSKYKINKAVNITKNIKYKNNNVILFIIITIIIIGIIFGHSGSIALGGEYGQGNSSVSSLNEYVIILFILSFIYTGNSKKKNFIILMLAGIYTLINILYGDRIGILMLGIAIFMFKYNNRYDYKKIIFIIGIVAIIFSGIGILRVYGTLITNNKDKVIETNQGNVFIASNQIIRLRDEKIIEKSDLPKSFIEYFSRIIIPKHLLSDISDPSVYAYEHYKESLGGGFIASYWYLWFGMPGVIFIGFIVAILIIKIKTYNDNYKVIFLISIIAFFPRWIGYEPLQIIKIPIISVILYWILQIIESIINNGLNKYKN